MSIRVRGEDRKSHGIFILTEEDKILLEYAKLSLYEDRIWKMEACSEGEEEVEVFGNVRYSTKMKDGTLREMTTVGYAQLKEGFPGGRKSWACDKHKTLDLQRRKRELYERLNTPPVILSPSISKKKDKYLILIPFERLGKRRYLEIETPSLDADLVNKIVDEKISNALASIPQSEVIEESLKDYCKKELRSFLKKFK